jgi:hypothetical protein
MCAAQYHLAGLLMIHRADSKHGCCRQLARNVSSMQLPTCFLDSGKQFCSDPTQEISAATPFDPA